MFQINGVLSLPKIFICTGNDSCVNSSSWHTGHASTFSTCIALKAHVVVWVPLLKWSERVWEWPTGWREFLQSDYTGYLIMVTFSIISRHLSPPNIFICMGNTAKHLVARQCCDMFTTLTIHPYYLNAMKCKPCRMQRPLHSKHGQCGQPTDAKVSDQEYGSMLHIDSYTHGLNPKGNEWNRAPAARERRSLQILEAYTLPLQQRMNCWEQIHVEPIWSYLYNFHWCL